MRNNIDNEKMKKKQALSLNSSIPEFYSCFPVRHLYFQFCHDTGSRCHFMLWRYLIMVWNMKWKITKEGGFTGFFIIVPQFNFENFGWSTRFCIFCGLQGSREPWFEEPHRTNPSVKSVTFLLQPKWKHFFTIHCECYFLYFISRKHNEWEHNEWEHNQCRYGNNNANCQR